MKNCSFGRTQLPFLGHLVTTEGVMPDPDNVKKLEAHRPPTTVIQTRSFLIFVNYYRRFTPVYAEIAKPLYNLTRKESKFVWTSECQTSFEVLKEKVTRSPLLFYPRFDQPFVLATDASNGGCGLCCRK